MRKTTEAKVKINTHTHTSLDVEKITAHKTYSDIIRKCVSEHTHTRATNEDGNDDDDDNDVKKSMKMKKKTNAGQIQ